MTCVQISEFILRFDENAGYYLHQALTAEECPKVEVESSDDETFTDANDSGNCDGDYWQPSNWSEDKYLKNMYELDQKNLLFYLPNMEDLTKIKIDYRSMYSATPQPIANSIAQKFIRSLKIASPDRKNFVIMDAFCGIGGNTIQFALQDCVSAVYAIDSDPKKIAIAKKIAKLYGCYHKIKYFTADFCELIQEKSFNLSVDACFLGLPWCWKRTSKYSMHDISPDGFHIIDLTAYYVTCNIALSLPLNFFKAELQTVSNTVYDSLGLDDSYDDDYDYDGGEDNAALDYDDDEEVDSGGEEDAGDDGDGGQVPYYLDMYQIEKYHNNCSMIVYFGDLVNTAGQQRTTVYYPILKQ